MTKHGDDYVTFVKEEGKTTNGVSTKIVKLDLGFLLDHCHKPALWGKTWTIFAYGEFRITLGLDSINTRSRYVSFTMRLWKKGMGDYVSSAWGTMYMDKEHRNFKVLESGINRLILNEAIENYEDHLTEKTPAYSEARDLEKSIVAAAEDAAEELLDNLGIKHEDVRDAYISSQRDKYETTKHSNAVLKLYRGTKTTRLYLAYCLFAGDAEKYEYYKKIANLNGFKVGALRKEIQIELDMIESGEMAIDLDEL